MQSLGFRLRVPGLGFRGCRGLGFLRVIGHSTPAFEFLCFSLLDAHLASEVLKQEIPRKKKKRPKPLISFPHTVWVARFAFLIPSFYISRDPGSSIELHVTIMEPPWPPQHAFRQLITRPTKNPAQT